MKPRWSSALMAWWNISNATRTNRTSKNRCWLPLQKSWCLRSLMKCCVASLLVIATMESGLTVSSCTRASGWRCLKSMVSSPMQSPKAHGKVATRRRSHVSHVFQQEQMLISSSNECYMTQTMEANVWHMIFFAKPCAWWPQKPIQTWIGKLLWVNSWIVSQLQHKILWSWLTRWISPWIPMSCSLSSWNFCAADWTPRTVGIRCDVNIGHRIDHPPC